LSTSAVERVDALPAGRETRTQRKASVWPSGSDPVPLKDTGERLPEEADPTIEATLGTLFTWTVAVALPDGVPEGVD
jgi:hypothetical protein